MLPCGTGICCYAFVFVFFYNNFLLLLSIPFSYYFKSGIDR